MRSVVLLGAGDSRHAALSARWPFTAGGVTVRVTSGSTLKIEERLDQIEPLVVGVSATASNPSVVAGLRRAHDQGWQTAAVACVTGPTTEIADHAVVLAPPDLAPCPGIRTHQALVIGLLAIATAAPRLAAASALRRELESTAEIAVAQVATQRRAETVAPELAAVLDALPVVVVVTPEAAEGTARHLAAKLTETAGIRAQVAELEDWWHVHRFGHPPQDPVVFLVPPGPPREAAMRFATRTAERGPIIVLAASDDAEALALGEWSLALEPGPPRVQALVDAVPATVLGLALARRRGRSPFDRG